MIKGEKIRKDVHNILYSVYKFNNTLHDLEIKRSLTKIRKRILLY